MFRLRYNDNASSPVITDAGQLACIATQTFTRAFSRSLFAQSHSFHTYALIIGIAYLPVFVSIAPFVLGSFTSIMKLLGIPVLFFILGTGSKSLSCEAKKCRHGSPEDPHLKGHFNDSLKHQKPFILSFYLA